MNKVYNFKIGVSLEKIDKYSTKKTDLCLRFDISLFCEIGACSVLSRITRRFINPLWKLYSNVPVPGNTCKDRQPNVLKFAEDICKMEAALIIVCVNLLKQDLWNSVQNLRYFLVTIYQMKILPLKNNQCKKKTKFTLL